MNTFATKPEVQKKALKKALLSTKIGKHGKRKETLLKEEVYKQIQAKILEKADKLIDAQIKVALTGNGGEPDPRVIELLLNRAFGKPAQEIGVKNTSIGMGDLLDSIEEENNNVMSFQWEK
jgi:hypothetical protein